MSEEASGCQKERIMGADASEANCSRFCDNLLGSMNVV